MKIKLIAIFLILPTIILAQREADFWYFGNNAGLSFSTGDPVAITNGALFTREGCATISDNAGNLLLYTDGQIVWNKNHVQMENGTGLMGNSSATQSGIIVPKPGSTSIYYIFTVPQCTDPDGLKYSIVDMTFNAGLGKVIQKNIPLVNPVVEKVTAVRHSNNTDIWVITHGRDNNTFYSYLVSASGVNTTPVITNSGSVHGPDINSYVGYLKASPDGNYLACAVQYPNGFFELFNFNSSTGTMSNPIKFSGYEYAYGIEFSPDESKLYLGKIKLSSSDLHGRVYQANLQAGSSTAIINSVVTINSQTTYVGALQAGNNGKIYITSDYTNNLDVIHNPNELGSSCNYQFAGLSLAGKQGRFGLPTFIQSYFSPRSFTYTGACFGQTTFFSILNPNGIDSAHWDFGDPTSQQNFLSAMSASHLFSSAGSFNVTLTVYQNAQGVSSTQNIVINPLPVVDLGNDTTLCGITELTLDAGSGFAEYQWSTGWNGRYLTVTSGSTYGVTVTTNAGCLGYDDIKVSFFPKPTGKSIYHE
ncbi:MAG: PKD domain-containing protein [Bacteroidales bacterium]|nr:PKD domain-containing protein [Bacteroidales bacterium]